jgi:pimeloyl-ACP methyl ester carboxylesterase
VNAALACKEFASERGPVKKGTVMAQTTTQKVTKQAASKAAIRPFSVNIPQADLEELRRRINATRWPDRETVLDSSQGAQLATMQKLARYWAADYDWRKVEARLNALPQFNTELEGVDIHFIHARSKHEDALPIIITPGWPASVTHYVEVVEPLINPTAHGASAGDAFHVVIPSMPGYGFSAKPTTTGWDPLRIGRAWVVLMKRLGYTKFVAQGGDWGAIVTELMAGGRDAPTPAEKAPPGLIGIHTNMAGAVPGDIARALREGEPPPAGLSAEEQRAYEQLVFIYKHVAYAVMMGTHPQSLTGIADSPIGMVAFMFELDLLWNSYEKIARAFDGKAEAVTRDQVLDNLTVYWLTNTAISAARLYWENKHSFFDAKGVSIPVAVSVFPEELYQPPRSWAAKAYPKLIHYNQLDKGGHFPAWEQSKLFCDEVRAAFRSLRKSSS